MAAFVYDAAPKYSSTMAAFDRMLLATPFGVVYFMSRSFSRRGSLERNRAFSRDKWKFSLNIKNF